ncbi:MAG: quinone-dependent dihydroorotate dehydrogenase [Myxococcales bacterium]|nr:quinone-dependent dihydroorotate dehydrogenase [Myxococcales bacterium]MCB9627425.1 quinone-dependent dihydroorotate dehydrogenase [Sandaracinaceae bacterium]
MFYRFLLRPLLYLLPAETAHHLTFAALRLLARLPLLGALLRKICVATSPALETQALGMKLRNPIGLAAGFDKDAQGIDALSALGFGFIEVGTLTGQAQPGNPKPRLFRLVADRALVNRMGFNNGGSAAAAERLAAPRTARVGVNLGKSKVVPEDEAAADYVLSAERLAPHADYVVVNVSSPNTPGLRNLQAVEKLRPLLEAVCEAVARVAPVNRKIPVLVKIAPDLADDDIDAVADLATELGLDGIIATNTTISRAGLRSHPRKVEACGAGGLSGAPLEQRSLAVLRRLRARVGPGMTLVAVGGVETAAQAYARIRAGASLIQIYTAFVYHGPMLPKRLALGLERLARRDGFERVADAVGVDAPPSTEV